MNEELKQRIRERLQPLKPEQRKKVIQLLKATLQQWKKGKAKPPA